MRTAARNLLTLLLLSLVPMVSGAQCIDRENACAPGVPHFVKFSGTLKTVLPPAGVVAVRFVIYGDATGGTALWQEVQNTQVDSQGRYEVMLGSTVIEGIPMGLFTSGEPRWLGVQPLLPGAEEQPRVLLVSVPYALEAADAQSLGGLPASAFLKATPPTAIPSPSGVVAPSEGTGTRTESGLAVSPSPNTPAVTSTATVNTIPKFAAGGTFVNSQITDANGTVSVQNLANILFADRFPGGVPDAVAACPASGCIIYALSQNTNLNLGTIDPGNKAITLYLGPYTYTVNQITLRKALKIIGMGATCNAPLFCSGTTLQSVNGNNPVFVLPQTNNQPATNVLLSGFRLYGSAGNTSEDGFFLDTSSTVTTGLWYSTLEDIYMEGFKGIAMHVRGRNDNFSAGSQWLLFNNVIVYRTSGGGNALRLEGAVFELRFRNCQFDGQAAGDGTNIYIGGVPGGLTGYPISIAFEGLVSQGAALAVQIDGALNLTFYGSHHEGLFGGYRITNNTIGIGTKGVTISDSYFAGNVGSNGGAGFELSVETTVATGIYFVHNQLFGNPDAIVKSTNLASVVYQDNLYAGLGNVPPTSGITTQLTPATSINVQGVHSIGLNPSTTPITTIQSSLGPGEMVTVFTLGGPVIFGSGGNINLMRLTTLRVNGSITFIRNDLTGSLQWTPVAQWNSPSSAIF
jgi:hypothetical protein